MTLIPRKVEPVLLDLLTQEQQHRDVVLVEGARQVGKTTLVERVLTQTGLPSHSINLERQARLRVRIDETREFSEFEELLLDELAFDPDSDCVLFIDEAQESRKLGGYVRFMKEAWAGARVVLSGSTLARVFREDVRYPVGRVRRIVVRPFTFSEFLAAHGRERMAGDLLQDPENVSPDRHGRWLEFLDQFLSVGGMPEVVLMHAGGGDFLRRREEILADYGQDFIRLFGEDSTAIAMGCLRSVANFVGSPSKNSSVIPQPTNKVNDEIRRVFGRLEAWRMVLHSEQRGPSPEASHRYLPKRYLFDTGLLRHLREKTVPRISIVASLDAAERRPLGGVAENQVAIELADRYGGLAGWKKSSSGLEIDFVCRVEDRVVPVECKAVLEPKQTHLRGLKGFLRHHGQRVGVMVSLGPFEVVETEPEFRILNVPLYLAEHLPELLAAHLQAGKLRPGA